MCALQLDLRGKSAGLVTDSLRSLGRSRSGGSRNDKNSEGGDDDGETHDEQSGQDRLIGRGYK
jgi:hypothetical protein